MVDQVLSNAILSELGELLARGHGRFGTTAPRKPYSKDEEKGDSGIGETDLRFETHPYLANMPEGAPSDLTANTQESRYSQDAAEDRANEASPELQPSLQNKLSMGKSFNPTPTKPM